MGPKRKTQSPTKQDKPGKKVHIMDKDLLVGKSKDDNAEKYNAGKESDVNMEAENTSPTIKKENTVKKSIKDDEKPSQADLSTLALNQLLQQKSKLSSHGSVSWKTYLFPRLFTTGSVSAKSIAYFGLDLVEEESERTVWTHKPSVWRDVVNSIFELAHNSGVSPCIKTIFKGMMAVGVRAGPDNPNEIETFKSYGGKNIQHWILLIPMPADIDSSEYIQIFISELAALAKKTMIRDAYHFQVSTYSKHHGLLNQISANGNYWILFDQACHKDVITYNYKCLSEVLTTLTIKEVVSKGLGVSKDTNTWTESIKFYAFGI